MTSMASLHPSRVIFPRGLACALAVLCSLATLHSQQNDGFAVQEHPGLALIKPQPWSPPEEAKVMEFQAYTDRSVKNSPGAGYYEFRTKQTDRPQIAASRVVKLLLYPDTNQYPTLATPEDRANLAAAIDELNSTLDQFPAVRTYLQPPVKKLQVELGRYDGGEVKVDGLWQSRESFLAAQINSLGAQMRSDIVRAKSTSGLDLNTDPPYLALMQLAKTSPGAQAMVNDLTQLFAKRQRAEQRQDLLDQLGGSSLSYAEAQGAVARLRTMQPEEDPTTDAFLKKWDESVVTMEASNVAAQPLITALESEFSTQVNLQTLPVISVDLGMKLSNLCGQVRLFVATAPPPVLLVESSQPVALYKTIEGFQKLRPLFQQKHFLEAKDIVDPLVRKSSAVGAETARVVACLQGYVMGQIEQFTKAREEAKLLLDSGKQPEALAKFEMAYNVIPDTTVGDQIAQLKKNPLSPGFQ